MIARAVVSLVIFNSVALAGVRSGKAEVEWRGVAAQYQAGKPLQTALRLVLDEGWHTYWENPGEGGMKISVTWKLPPGWVAGELEHPIPQRFAAGGLAGFGYKGSVVFPVAFTAPPDATGPVKLTGKVSWLTCNDESCIPGDAELALALDSSAAVPTEDTPWIHAALAHIPRSRASDLHLVVRENSDSLLLKIQPEPGISLDLTDRAVFPATPDCVAPSALIEFKRVGAHWLAEVPKGEYAPTPLRELRLVFAEKAGCAPFSLTWKNP